MLINETAIVKIEEHRNEKVVCFTVDCVDPENEAWGKMSEWCKKMCPTAQPEDMWELRRSDIIHRARNIKTRPNM